MITQENERLWSVYKHTSPSGKIYIGIAKDPKHRWRGDGNGYKGSTRIWYAIQKYGWENFKHEIIARNLTRDEACRLEIAVIRSFNTTNPEFGYNLTTGGQCPAFSPESIERLRQSQTGHPVSEKVRNILANVNKTPIICLDTGEIFDSGKEASDKLGLCCSSIIKASNGRQDTCGGLHFAKLSDYENGCVKQFTPSPAKYNRVRCITTGEEFDNVSDASRKTGLSRRAISYACNGEHETCGGMQWEFIKEDNHV